MTKLRASTIKWVFYRHAALNLLTGISHSIPRAGSFIVVIFDSWLDRVYTNTVAIVEQRYYVVTLRYGEEIHRSSSSDNANASLYFLRLVFLMLLLTGEGIKRRWVAFIVSRRCQRINTTDKIRFDLKANSVSNSSFFFFFFFFLSCLDYLNREETTTTDRIVVFIFVHKKERKKERKEDSRWRDPLHSALQCCTPVDRSSRTTILKRKEEKVAVVVVVIINDDDDDDKRSTKKTHPHLSSELRINPFDS